MELPKNVTQIGEPDRSCKIYVEDYVISYMKQLNVNAGDKEMAVALYGRMEKENGVTYLFFYGACRLNFLQKESRHLPQAVCQEAEEMRRKYFSQYAFLGYRILNGEMVDGFHICDQGVCRYIEGYARFYEKNDGMLAFMLEDRKETAQPETVNQEKYDEVKKRQEERRSKSEGRSGQAGLLQSGFRRKEKDAPRQEDEGEAPASRDSVSHLKRMKYSAAAVFAVLLAAGFLTLNQGGAMANFREAAEKWMEQISARQLPDTMETVHTEGGVTESVAAGSVVMEDNYSEALQRENEAAIQAAGSGSVETPDTDGTVPTSAPSDTGNPPETTETPAQEQTGEPETGMETGVGSDVPSAPEGEPGQDESPESEPAPTAAPVSYTVKWGDTLIAICIEHYGSDEMVKSICDFNGISNPDDIKEGQKILLP